MRAHEKKTIQALIETDRRMQEAAQKLKRDRNDLFDNIIQKNADGILIVDKQGDICFVNPACELIFGRKKEELLGIAFGFFLVPGIKEELRVSHKSGEIRDIEVRTAKIFWEGKPAFLVSVRDIAERKEIEKLKSELIERKHIDEVKNTFISTVSHELRTPLTTMKEFASIIADEIPGKLTKEQREYIDIIKGNIDRLARLINNLLDISKIEAGKVEFKRGLCDFASLVKQAAETFKAQVREKGLDLKLDVPQKPIDIYVDADKINQILTNILNNALRFTEKGYIEISVKESKNEVECAVADTGRGIAKENLPKVFEKFQQFERTPGAGEKGTGLGLAITRDLIGMHSGRIWVESQYGKGTRFTFSLPKYTTEQLFKEYVNNGIKEAIEKGSNMSLIVVSIAELERLKEGLPTDQIQSILKDMEDVLKNSLRRAGDVAVRNTGEIVVLLEGCDKEKALSIEARLKQALEDYLTRQNLAKKIELRFGRATYPGEANNHEELINKARQP